MKKYIVALFCLFSSSISFAQYACSKADGSVQFYKWRHNPTNALILTDVEKSSFSVNPLDFTGVSPSSDEVAFTTTVFNASLGADGFTCSNLNTDLPDNILRNYATLKDAIVAFSNFKSAIIPVAVYYAGDLNTCNFMQSNGVSLPARISRDRSILEFIRRMVPTLQ